MDLLYQWLATHFKTTFLLFLFANSLFMFSQKCTNVEIGNEGEKAEAKQFLGLYFVMVFLLFFFDLRGISHPQSV